MIFRPLKKNFGKFGRAGKKQFTNFNQPEKSYQNDESLFLGFEKVVKMQASVMRVGERLICFGQRTR